MTLSEIIAAHEAASAPLPIDAGTACVTAKGHACVAAHRFLTAVQALDPTDRADVLAMFGHQLRGIIADLATGA